MFEFFKNAFSSSSKGNKLILGVSVRYEFFGKPIYFDPIAMLEEIGLKLKATEQEAISKLNLAIEDIKNEELIIQEKLPPAVSAYFTIGKNEIKVQRSVKNFGVQPISRYQFFAGDILFAVFQRRYDYGKDFEACIEKLKEYTDNLLMPHSHFVHLQNQKSQDIYLEKFGHSQIWLIFKRDLFDDLLSQI